MLCVRTALVEAVAPQGAFCISSPGPLHLAMQHSQKFNSSQEPRVRNKICVLTCEERQVGRQRAALPVPQLPPCSWHRPGGAQLLMSLETKLRAVESLTKKKKSPNFPPMFPSGMWPLHQTLLTGSGAAKAFQCPAQFKAEMEVWLWSHPCTACHTQRWQQATGMSFPPVSWISLTPVLQILMILLPRLSWRQSISLSEL